MIARPTLEGGARGALDGRPQCVSPRCVVLLLAGCGTGDESAEHHSSSAVTSTPSTTIKGDLPDTPYEAGLRRAYMPVLATLSRTRAPCEPATLARLPRCRAKLEAFLAAIGHLGRYVTDTPPPADAAPQARTLAAAVAYVQVWFGRLDKHAQKRDTAAMDALGGFGPLTKALTAFNTAVEALDTKLPGKRLPAPCC
jgi:hypothetical protein